jgi:hypothetical protein
MNREDTIRGGDSREIYLPEKTERAPRRIPGQDWMERYCYISMSLQIITALGFAAGMATLTYHLAN